MPVDSRLTIMPTSIARGQLIMPTRPRSTRFGQDIQPSDPPVTPKTTSPTVGQTLLNWAKQPFKWVMAAIIGVVSMLIAAWVERWINEQLAPLLQGVVQTGKPAALPPKPDNILPSLSRPIDPAITPSLETRQPLPAAFFTDPDAVTRQQALLIKSLKAHKRALEHGPRVTGFYREDGQPQVRSLGLDSYRDKQGLTLRQWRVALLAQTIYTQLQQANAMTDPLKSQHQDFWSTVFFEVFRYSGSQGNDKSIRDTLKRFEASEPSKAKVIADPAWTLSQFWPQRAKAAEQKALPVPDDAVTHEISRILATTVWPLIMPDTSHERKSHVQALPLPANAVVQVAAQLSRQLGIKPVKTEAAALTESSLARQAETASQLAKKFGAAVWVWDAPLGSLPEPMQPKVQAVVNKLTHNVREPVWMLFPDA